MYYHKCTILVNMIKLTCKAPINKNNAKLNFIITDTLVLLPLLNRK